MKLKEYVERRKAELPPQCFETSDRPPALSVELPDGEIWVLAWSRFSHAQLSGEELTLTFTSHEIRIRGDNLLPVMQAAAGLRLECLRTISPTYRPVMDAGETFICELEVRLV
jgi:hypothetical protein